MKNYSYDDLLLSRRVKNIGQNKVTLSVDLNFQKFLFERNKSCQGSFTLEPDQSHRFDHFYVIITTDDGKPAHLQHEF